MNAVLTLVLIAGCLGMPFLTHWQAFAAMLAIALVVASRRRNVKLFGPALVASMLCIVMTLLKGVLPTMRIEEGHQVFLPADGSDVYEANLPPRFFSLIKGAFNRAHPPATRCVRGVPGCWRNVEQPANAFALLAPTRVASIGTQVGWCW